MTGWKHVKIWDNTYKNILYLRWLISEGRICSIIDFAIWYLKQHNEAVIKDLWEDYKRVSK